MANFRAISSSRDDLYQGPGGYSSATKPFENFPLHYGNQRLNSSGIPVGTSAPDIVTGNRPPTSSGLSAISQGKVKLNPSKTVNALGMQGFTPASNFDLRNNGTSYDSTYTGIPQTNGVVSTQSSTGQTQQPNQLMISPTGQYQQIVIPNPKKAAAPTVGKPASKAAPKKAKKPSYGDSEYMSEIRALDRELADYRARMGLNKTRTGTQHSLSERDLRQQGDRDRSDLKDDFAARGIVLSGVYGSKLGEYNTLFGQQNSELDRQYKDALTDIQNQYKDYIREVGVQKEQARLAAIRRRAQKLGKI